LGPVVEELEQILDPSRPVSGRGRTAQRASGAPPVPERLPESPHGQGSMISTVTAMSQASGQHLEGLPGFVRSLPRPLQSQTGLMILAGAAVLVAMTLVYVGLYLAHLV
jgi:hypothetical protein